MTDDHLDYERDLAIDETILDVMLLSQADRMGRYCRLMAEAQRDANLAKERQDYEVSRAKEALELARAELDKAVRGDPARYGVVAGSRGVTEDAIKSAIQAHPAYQEAAAAFNEARYEYGKACVESRFRCDVVAGAVRAFDHRKSALENLVRLHGQSYFAGPAVPHDLQEARAQSDSRAQQRVRMRRRGA